MKLYGAKVTLTSASISSVDALRRLAESRCSAQRTGGAYCKPAHLNHAVPSYVFANFVRLSPALFAARDISARRGLSIRSVADAAALKSRMSPPASEPAS